MEHKTDVVGWELERDGKVAVVREDGQIEADDPQFADNLSRCLRQPVTVYRRGTVARSGGDGAAPMTLSPGDGRYVAARVRTLSADPDGVRILSIVWDR
ncbi:MAG: hypothetical protein ACYCX9_05105 [Candidatus Dormibacteria bacterium]